MSQIPQKLLSQSGSLPEFVTQAGKNAIQAVQVFFDQAAAHSSRAHHLYGLYIAAFIRWCSTQGKSLCDICREDFDEYVEFLTQHYSEDYIRHQLGCLRRLFDVFVDNGVLQVNPVSHVSKPSPTKRPKLEHGIPSTLLNESGGLPAFFNEAGSGATSCIETFFDKEVSDKTTTRDHVVAALKLFIAWCDERSIKLCDFDHALASTYKAYLKSRFRPLTVSHYMGYLRRLFDLLAKERIVSCNPIVRLSKPHKGIGERVEWKMPSLSDPDSIPVFIRNAGKDIAQHFCGYVATLQDVEHRRDVTFALVRFCWWCEVKRIRFDQMEAATFAEYANELAQEYAAQTIANHVRYVSELCDWFVQHKVLSVNPVVKGIIPMPHRKHDIVLLPSVEHVHALLDSIETHTISGLRDRAIIAMMFYALAAPRDMYAMKVEDFFSQGESWWFRFSDGLKIREVPANSKVVAYLQAYLEGAGISETGDTYLFRKASRGGDRLSQHRMAPHGFAERVRIRGLKTSLPKSLKPLSIRAAGIKAYLNAGGTIEKAMWITGLTASGIQTYAEKSDKVVLYEGDLDGLLGFLGTSAADPLKEFVRKSGIFRLTVEQDNEPKED